MNKSRCRKILKLQTASKAYSRKKSAGCRCNEQADKGKDFFLAWLYLNRASDIPIGEFEY